MLTKSSSLSIIASALTLWYRLPSTQGLSHSVTTASMLSSAAHPGSLACISNSLISLISSEN